MSAFDSMYYPTAKQETAIENRRIETYEKISKVVRNFKLAEDEMRARMIDLYREVTKCSQKCATSTVDEIMRDETISHLGH